MQQKLDQTLFLGLLAGTSSDNEDQVEQDDFIHRLCPSYASDINSPLRHVRTRVYFTSESHMHSLLNALRYCHLRCQIPGSEQPPVAPAPPLVVPSPVPPSSAAAEAGHAAGAAAATPASTAAMTSAFAAALPEAAPTQTPPPQTPPSVPASQPSPDSVPSATLPDSTLTAEEMTLAAAVESYKAGAELSSVQSKQGAKEEAAAAAAGQQAAVGTSPVKPAGAAVAAAKVKAEEAWHRAEEAAAASVPGGSTPPGSSPPGSPAPGLISPDAAKLLESTTELDYLTHLVRCH